MLDKEIFDNETERYAKENIHFYVDNPDKYIPKDKPDLQNEKDGIGIEVCYSILPREAICENVLGKIYDLPYSKAKTYLLKNSKKFLLDLWDCGNERKALSPFDGMVDFEIHIKNTSKIILKKIREKLQHYLFPKTGLFVRIKYAFNEDNVQSVFSLVCEKMSVTDRHFDFYILDCPKFGYKCCVMNGKLSFEKIEKCLHKKELCNL